MTAIHEAELARLTKLYQHTEPLSAERIKLARKMDQLEARLEGRPVPDKPQEFARILAEMKIPSGQTVSDYKPGYRQRELTKAKAAAPASKMILPWQERGPGNVSGRARGVIVDPDDSNGNTWWVGSVGGGIWFTDDAGATWTDVAPNLPNLPISWLEMADSDSDIIYAGTGESFFNVDTIHGDGVLKSTDHGATWNQLPSTVGDPAFQNISRIIVDPNDPDIVVVSATRGRYITDLNQRSSIFKSTDGGTNWTEVHAETTIGSFNRVTKIQQVIDQPGNFNLQLAAVDEGGILRSTDAGDTWAFSNTGITDIVGRFEIAFAPSNPNRVYASAEGSSHSNLWVSDDAGVTWVQTFDVSSEPNWLGFQGWYDNTIMVHPTDQDIVWVGGIVLWQLEYLGGTSRNNFSLSTGPVHVDNHNLVLIPGSPFRILNANDGGIGVSSNEATGWSKPTLGMNTSQFYGVDKRPGQSAYIGGMQDNGTWRSPIDSQPLDLWDFMIGGDGYETSWHFNDPEMIVGGYQFNGILRSLDGGNSWSNAQPGDTGGGSAPFITKIGKTNDDPELLFAVGAQGVWRSDNFAASWTLIPLSAPDWAPISSFTDVRVSRANPDVVWAGARMDGTGRIHVSTDGGLSFNPTTNYTTATMGGISGLSTHPTDDSIAYTLFSFAEKPKVLMTDDHGVTWTDISGFGAGTTSSNGFPDVAVYDLLVFPHDTDTIWVGSEIGLIESTDGGATWAVANNGLPNLPIWFMTHVEDEIVLATHGRGIWSTVIAGMDAGQTYNPLLEKVFQGPDGMLSVQINQRSLYDDTEIWIDGALAQTLPANLGKQIQTVQFPVPSDATRMVQVISHESGTPYPSTTKSIDVVAMDVPMGSFVTDFNGGSSAWVGTGFTIGGEPGFSTDALHTDHNYLDQSQPTYMLTQPIIVATSGALIEFDEVALIEPGAPGSVFGDGDFWDYVIVEGSLDGCEWIPLVPGYDARAHPTWETAYNAGDPGDETMFVHRVINILDTFNTGDEILIRFRLFADPFVNGWGWVIDNLEIQEGAVAVGDTPVQASLDQNFPNPFNPSTTIQYSLPAPGDVSLKVYDLRGREVKTIVSEFKTAGSHSVDWDGTDANGVRVSSGSYVYRVVSGDFVDQKKMTLIK